jgi:phage gp29-like protein
MLYDAQGKIIRRPPASLPASPWLRSATPRIQPSDISLEDMLRAFRRADRGDLSAQGELWMALEEMDPHVLGESEKLAESVLSIRPQLLPADDTQAAIDAAEFVRLHLLEHPQFPDLQTLLGYTPLTGVQAAEIVWRRDGKAITIQEFRRIQHSWLLYAGHDGYLRDSPLIITDSEPMGIEPQPAQIVIMEHKPLIKHPSRTGKWRTIAIIALLKRYGWDDLAIYSERCGVPATIGKYPIGAGQGTIDELWEAVQALSGNGRVVVQDGTSITQETQQGNLSGSLWMAATEMYDKAISKAILGQTLSADSSGTGSYALGVTHENLRYEQVLRTGRRIASVITEQVIKPLILFNFGTSAPVPVLNYVAPKSVSRDQVQMLLQASQLVDIPQYYVYELLGIPRPEKGDEVTRTQTPAPMMARHSARVPTSQRLRAEARADVDRVSPPPEEALQEVQDNVDLILNEVYSAKDYNEAIERIMSLLSRTKSDKMREGLEQRLIAANLRGRQRIQDARP